MADHLASINPTRRTTATIGALLLSIGAVIVSSATSVSAQGAARLCDGLEATIVGTPNADRLVGTPEVDVIAGLQGNDVIFGLQGDDVICGGLGDDYILGGEGFDILFGAQGNDVLYAADGIGYLADDVRGARMFGGAGNDQLYGSNRWDRMQGGTGNDLILGLDGQDWIRSGGSADFVDGGRGKDNIRTGWGDDRIDAAQLDDIRAGLGEDICTIDGQPSRVWSCEAQIPLDAAPYELRVEPKSGRKIGPMKRDPNFVERNVINRQVSGIAVQTLSIPNELVTASVVEFSGTIIDNGDGPEACLGPILDSEPVQCGGPVIDGLEFHPSWTTYYTSTRVGFHTVRFTWPPIDGRVQLVEERFNEWPYGDFGIDFEEERYPIPEQCQEIENYVNYAALQAWGEANPDLYGDVVASESRVPTLRVVGDEAAMQAARDELQTNDAEACVDAGEYTVQTLEQVRVELEPVLGEIYWTSIGIGIDRVVIDVALVDLAVVERIAEVVSVPGAIGLNGQLGIIE